VKFKFSPLILVCMATVAMHPLGCTAEGPMGPWPIWIERRRDPKSGIHVSESGTELFRGLGE
jgi:hypothetical protein